ncbi:MAG TPA: L,D-transpeptidase family protein [bacterium]|nr:L,D-transpeptidase family protein [bacterium]
MKVRVTLLLGIIALFFFVMGASCPKQTGTVNNRKPAVDAQAAKASLADGEALFQSGDYEGARAKYQEVLEKYPGTEWSNQAQFRLAQCDYSLGKTDEALAGFRQYVDNNKDNSNVELAKDYIVQIIEGKLKQTELDYQTMVAGLEQQNYRLELINKYLRKSVDSEVIYLELDLQANRVFVKIGSQTLYEYPVVTGKGKTRLKTTGKLVDFNTPKGIRQVESIEKDPKWYRPDWVWLEHGETVPEDLTMEDRAVEKVLGPYKISIGEGYYFHGTRRGTIRPGKFSHGCIRLNNKDLIQLVRMIEAGTMVYIY